MTSVCQSFLCPYTLQCDFAAPLNKRESTPPFGTAFIFAFAKKKKKCVESELVLGLSLGLERLCRFPFSFATLMVSCGQIQSNLLDDYKHMNHARHTWGLSANHQSSEPPSELPADGRSRSKIRQNQTSLDYSNKVAWLIYKP